MNKIIFVLGHIWQCTACFSTAELNVSKKGYRNLAQHVITNHKNYHIEMHEARQSTTLGINRITGFIKIGESPTDNCKLYFSWIEWVVMGHHPLSFVENTYTREYSHRGRTCSIY